MECVCRGAWGVGGYLLDKSGWFPAIYELYGIYHPLQFNQSFDYKSTELHFLQVEYKRNYISLQFWSYQFQQKRIRSKAPEFPTRKNQEYK